MRIKFGVLTPMEINRGALSISILFIRSIYMSRPFTHMREIYTRHQVDRDIIIVICSDWTTDRAATRRGARDCREELREARGACHPRRDIYCYHLYVQPIWSVCRRCMCSVSDPGTSTVKGKLLPYFWIRINGVAFGGRASSLASPNREPEYTMT